VPDHTARDLRRVIAAATAWPHVLGSWSESTALAAGRALVCLLSGPPGTGKSLAAEVMASQLGAPLHLVRLPRLQSKWVGETENNVHDLFARARHSRAVVVFDEADILFANRVGVRTGQDQAVNLVTGLLLQELDRHAGVVVLTSNLEINIDPAFHRRVLYRVAFPLPDPEIRRALWQRLMPATIPRGDDLDLELLARRYPLTGGEIRNVVLRAALAAWTGGQLAHRHLEEECERECQHNDRPVELGTYTIGQE
jgi:SpoVK/Ycf46/Vps4 family AAA+-type ATPase